MEIKHDSIEDTEYFKSIKKEVDEKIKKEVGDTNFFGGCHLYWSVKKMILKRDYNIDWKSPAELNPHIIFD